MGETANLPVYSHVDMVPAANQIHALASQGFEDRNVMTVNTSHFLLVNNNYCEIGRYVRSSIRLY